MSVKMSKESIFSKHFVNPKNRFITVNGLVCKGGGGENGISFSDGNVVAKGSLETTKLMNIADVFSPYSNYTLSSANLMPGDIYEIPTLTFGEQRAEFSFELPLHYKDPFILKSLPKNFGIEFDLTILDPFGECVTARLKFNPIDATSQVQNFFSCLGVPISLHIETKPLLDLNCGLSKNADIFKTKITDKVHACLSKASKRKYKTEEYKRAYMIFKSDIAGYKFHIRNVKVHEYILSDEYPESPFDKDSEDDTRVYKEVKLVEDVCRRVAPIRYKNGAYKGLIVKPEYPKFNADDIKASEKTILLTHIPDNLSLLGIPQKSDMSPLECEECQEPSIIFDEDDEKYFDGALYYTNEEFETILQGLYIGSEEPSDKSKIYVTPPTKKDTILEKDNSKLPAYNGETLVEYLKYVSLNNLWNVVGDIYIIMGQDDSDENFGKNMVRKAVISNPHPFPIKVNFITYI